MTYSCCKENRLVFLSSLRFLLFIFLCNFSVFSLADNAPSASDGGAPTASDASTVARVYFRKKNTDYAFRRSDNIEVYSGRSVADPRGDNEPNFHSVILDNDPSSVFPQPAIDIFYSVVKDGNGGLESINLYMKNITDEDYDIDSPFGPMPACSFYGGIPGVADINNNGDRVGSIIKQRFGRRGGPSGINILFQSGNVLLWQFDVNYLFNINSSLQADVTANLIMSCNFFVEQYNEPAGRKESYILKFSQEFIDLKLNRITGDLSTNKKFDPQLYVDEVLIPALESVPGYGDMNKRIGGEFYH